MLWIGKKTLSHVREKYSQFEEQCQPHTFFKICDWIVWHLFWEAKSCIITTIVQERWFSMWLSQSVLSFLLNNWDRLFCDSFQTKKVFLMVINYRSNDAMLLNKSLRWNSGLVSGFACKRLEIDIKFNFPGHSIWLLHWLLEQPHFMDRERLLPDIPPSVWPFWTTGRQVKIFSGQQHLKPNTTSWLIHNPHWPWVFQQNLTMTMTMASLI